MQLQLLLQNLHNAPWPKDFNPEAFVLPTEDLPVVKDAQEINRYNFTDEEMQNMAKAILHENETMKGSTFYNQWLIPIETYFQINKIPLHEPKA